MARNLFAPPTEDELFAPPPKAEKQTDPLFAPPREEELFAPPPAVGASVDKELEDRSFFNKPAFRSEGIKQAEYEQVARKHGVDPAELRSKSLYVKARPEDATLLEEAQAGLSVVAGIPTLGGAQKLYKKTQDPAMEKALDDVQSLAEGRGSWLQFGSEVVGPGGLAAKAGSKIATKVGAAAATGALAGGFGAREGKELEGAAAGAVLGGALGGVLSKLARRGENLTKAETEVLQKSGPDLDAGTESVLKERAASEKEISDLIDGTKELDQPVAQRIVNEQLDRETLELAMKQDTIEHRLMQNRVDKLRPEEVRDLGYERTIERQLAQDMVEKRARDFAEDLTKSRPKTLDDARLAIQEHAGRQGKEATAERYRLFVENEAAEKYIQRSAARGGRGDNFPDKALNFVSDAQFVLRDIDEKLGTSLEPVHRQLNSSINRMSFVRDAARKDLNQIFKQNREVDDVVTKTDKVYQAMDSGALESLTPEEQKVAQEFRDYFAKQLDYVNNVVREKDPLISPMAIPKRENYVPHMLADTQDLRQRAGQKVAEAKQFATQITGRPITDLSQLSQSEFRQLENEGPFKDLISGVMIFDAKPPRTPADLSARIKDIFEGSGGVIKLETMAKSALERSGDMPMWMRETNLYKLADKWSSNTLKHLYLRKQMDQIRSIAGRLEKAGADLEAKYVKNLLSDINGIRQGTMAAAFLKGETKYQEMLDGLARRFPGPRAQGVLGVARAIPTMLGDLNRQVYPNMLGLSPRSILMNATQTIAKTAPELGTKYGYTTLVRGAVHAVLNMKTVSSKLQRLGFVPAEFNAKYRRAVADGVRRSSLYSLPNNVIQGMGDAAMFLYTKMDMINRAITLSTAEMMAKDLASGSQAAAQTLKKFPSTVQKQVARAQSPEQVAEIIGSHLNASTQFNYNRASMSEYGRTMGGLFSTFSKWPSATAGEMVQELRDKGALKGTLRNAEKYVAPLLLFQAADYLLFGGDPEQMTDRQKKIMGSSGLSQAAPIGSGKAILTGDFFTPPAVDAIVQGIVAPAISGDEGKVQKGIASAIQNFTPGSVYVRFLTDDLPTLISGDRPEGGDFLERTLEGSRQLAK